jgi:hypothetical protein
MASRQMPTGEYLNEYQVCHSILLQKHGVSRCLYFARFGYSSFEMKFHNQRSAAISGFSAATVWTFVLIFVIKVTAVGTSYFDYFPYDLFFLHYRLSFGRCLVLNIPGLNHLPKRQND